MLCPRCLTDVTFARFVSEFDGEQYWKCPACGKDNIPLRYADRYDQFRVQPISLLGAPGHGKTRFLVGLFKQLREIRGRWPGFFTDALDQFQASRLDEMLQRYEAGEAELPSLRQRDLPEPLLYRLHHVPRVGHAQVIVYDTSGEAFLEAAVARTAAAYLRNSPTAIWLASLQQEDESGSNIVATPPRMLDGIATTYLQAMANLNGDTKQQNLILTLTKGERLIGLPGFPPLAADLLQSDLVDQADDPWAKLEAASAELTDWLAGTIYAELLNRLRGQFRRVFVCTISAQGGEWKPTERRVFEPKSVLAPLYWLWRADSPGVWVEAGPDRTYHLSLEDAVRKAPKNAVLRLEAGQHVLAEPLEISRPMELTGDGRDRTTIVGGGGKFALCFAPMGAAKLSNLTVERGGTAGPGDLVWALRGQVTVLDVRFRKATSTPAAVNEGDTETKAVDGNGLVFAKEATGTVERCEFSENQRAGVWVFARGEVTIRECSARANRYGLLVSAAGVAAVTGGEWERNKRLGIWVADQGQLHLTGGKLLSNERDGLRVTEDGRVKLTNVEAVGNAGHGVAFRKRGGGTIDGGTFDRNLTGISVEDEARVELLRLSASGNRTDGATFSHQTHGLVEGCTLQGNGGFGLRLADTTQADAARCRTDGNHTSISRPSRRPDGGVLVAGTVAKSVKVTDCGKLIDERKRGLFG